jgi:hypothetical protein
LHKPIGQVKVRFNGTTIYLGKYKSGESWEVYNQFIASLPKPGEVSAPGHSIS